MRAAFGSAVGGRRGALLWETAAMFVRISGPDAQPELVEAADCKRFHVEYGSAPASAAEVAAALGSWADGATDAATDDHVWIRIDAVRTAAAPVVEAGWAADFDGMLSFAASKGWLNEAGDAIAAHIVTPA